MADPFGDKDQASKRPARTIGGTATVRTAAPSAHQVETIRRASRYAGTAASDIITELIALAAA